MKRFVIFFIVLVMVAVVGCAQSEEGDGLVQVTKIIVKIANNAELHEIAPPDPYIWAVGDLGRALGGTIDFWNSKAKLVGAYGFNYQVVATNFSYSDTWHAPHVLDFLFIVSEGNTAPDGGVEMNNGGSHFSIPLTISTNERGVEKSTSNSGVTYICE